MREKKHGLGAGGHRPERVSVTLDPATAEAVRKRQEKLKQYAGVDLSFSAACAALIRQGVKQEQQNA